MDVNILQRQYKLLSSFLKEQYINSIFLQYNIYGDIDCFINSLRDFIKANQNDLELQNIIASKTNLPISIFDEIKKLNFFDFNQFIFNLESSNYKLIKHLFDNYPLSKTNYTCVN